jgi:hypothetical protein
MSNLYRGPSIEAPNQVSVHLAKWFQRRRFLEIDQSETRIVCGLLTNRDEISNLYRGPSIDASY